MEKKSVSITALVTILLFGLVIFLLYVIFCYSFYDKSQEENIIENFNNGNYDSFYDTLFDKKYISKEEYNYSINLMFKKNELNEIYNKYYSDLKYEEFINKYYYRNRLTIDDLKVITEGKTTLFKRRITYCSSIKIRNNNDEFSSFGVKKDVSFSVDEDIKLVIDERGCELKDKVCHYDYILGGLHTVKYEKDGIEYFGLVNVVKDNSNITIDNLDSLVKIVDVTDVIDNIDVSLDE